MNYDKLINRERGPYVKVFLEGVRTTPSDEGMGYARKMKGKYFPIRTEQRRLKKSGLYSIWLVILPLLA